MEREEADRSLADDGPAVPRAVWYDVDVSLNGERALVGDVGEGREVGGASCPLRNVDAEAEDRTDAPERTDETEGASDFGLKDDVLGFVPFKLDDNPLFGRDARGVAAGCFIADLVTIEGADGRDDPAVLTEDTEDATEPRLDAKSSLGLISSPSPPSPGPVLAAFRLSTLARRDAGAIESFSRGSRVLRRVELESVRCGVARFGTVGVTGERRSSTGTSSSTGYGTVRKALRGC